MNMCRLTVLFAITAVLTALWGCGVGFNLSPYFYIAVDSYDFGKTILTASKTVDIKIENHGPASMLITFLSIRDDTGADSAEFKIITLFDNDGDIIPAPYSNILMTAKTKLTARIEFKPNLEKEYSANFKILHSASNKSNPYFVELKGTGQNMISPSILDFGKIVSNVREVEEVRIDNYHTSTITINKIEISSGSLYFRILGAKRNGVIAISSSTYASFLEPGEFIIVSIEASSPGIATRSGSIAVHHDIGEIYSPVYANLKVTSQENYPPVIQSVTLNKPVVKANGSDFVNLSVKVTDPNGLADISAVIADLTEIGKTYTQLYDNGQNGDALVNDGVYTLRFAVNVKDNLVRRIKINITALDYNNEHADAFADLFYYTNSLLEVDSTGGHSYSNLKSALTLAVDGDYILVYNGSYEGLNNTAQTVNDKEILIRSVNGAEHTTINCRNIGQGILFDSQNGRDAIFQGFTISNAKGTYGGGINIGYGASPQILDCVFTSCKATYGGGIFCDQDSKPVIERCSFNSNTATLEGGGIYVNYDSEAEILDCTVIENSAPNGGGIYCNEALPTISSCEIYDNKATTNGAGIYFDACPDTKLTDSLIASNISLAIGGALYSVDSSFMIERCSFENNRASSNAAGALLARSQGRIRNCRFVNNHSGTAGGAVSIIASILSLENCLVVNNVAGVLGGGYYMTGTSEVVLHNNTISKNEATTGGGIYYDCSTKTMKVYNTVIWVNVATTAKDIYCRAGYVNLVNADYYANTNNVYGQVTANSASMNLSPQFEDTTTSSLTGVMSFSKQSNIVNGSGTKFLTEVKAGDLVYLDVDGASKAITVAKVESNSKLILAGEYQGNGGYNTAIVVHVNYHLTNTSPCIDKGQQTFLPLGLATDLDDNSRVVNSNVDIGVYEYQ